MKDYYVYVYLNPTKEFNYTICDYEFKYKPYYVGKGCGKRYLQTHKDLMNNKSSNKEMIEEIKDIRLFHNQEPIIEIIKSGLNEKQAYLLESYLIDDLGLESLSNRINGRYMSLLDSESDIDELLELLEFVEM